MSRYALLFGSAPENFRQKKLSDMHDFLVSGKGGNWKEKEIIEFPNGLDDLTFSFTLNSLHEQEYDSVLIYICTQKPVEDSDESIWLGGEEIRKDHISFFESNRGNTSVQVIYDSCCDFISDESLGYEKVSE